jgi:RNA polymerase sigma-70 factor (ECF subfamily)
MSVVAHGVPSDAELVARCRAGDETAWSALVDRFSRYVYAIAVRVYHLPPADAEDVFQETFARAYEHLDRLRDDGAIRPWLAQLARRLAVDRLRAVGREASGDAPSEPGLADAELERLDDALEVRAALGTLSDACREILDRFFARDESYRTIGAALDIPPGTIASRISRCLGALRERLEGRSGPAGASGEHP